MILVNGKADDRIAVSDRGLQYGDGVFETIAYRNNTAEFLNAHFDRLMFGCQRLAIPFEQIELLKAELQHLCLTTASDVVIKIIITRGYGARGYLALLDSIPTRILSTHPSPQYPDSHYTLGIRARFCDHRLSENPALAGIKHLNRLDQVLARNEWRDETIAEGLMLDNHGHVIEGTMSNLFMVKSGRIMTPALKTSGIAGVMRAQIFGLSNAHGLGVVECDITTDMIAHADELFICNSVIGIWPIRQLAEYHYAVGSMTTLLQDALAKMKK